MRGVIYTVSIDWNSDGGPKRLRRCESGVYIYNLKMRWGVIGYKWGLVEGIKTISKTHHGEAPERVCWTVQKELGMVRGDDDDSSDDDKGRNDDNVEKVDR